jgi:hypothetical protein
MMLFLKRLYEFLVQAQVSIARFFTGLPFWKDVERISLIVAGPVRGVASLALRLFPFLRRFEKYLEVESLRSRSPVILAFSITLLAFRGILTSPNGHIGTDLSVFPLLTLISSFNPFLGGLSGLVFGAADLVQKLVKPDIYGAMTRSHPNYMGALAGYVAAYSITVWMGVMPGLVSRIGRDYAISLFRKIWVKRTTAHADGATPLPFDSWTGAAGLLGSIVGAMVTAFTGVRFVAPILEWPAFHWRPSPDVSCYNAELATLKATASRSAVTGIVGGGVVATTPPADSPPPIPIEVTPPPIPGAPTRADSTWPPRPGTERDGKVWYQPPWDEGGPVWMDKAEFEDMRSKQAQGLKWSGHHGWVTPEDERERDAIMARARTLNREQSEDVKAAYDKWLESRDRLRELQAEGDRLDRELKKLDVSMLERTSSRGVSASETLDAFVKGSIDTTVDLVPDLYNPTVLWETAKGSASEVGGGLGKALSGSGDLENYKAAGGAVLHSVKGMAEGVATIAKVGWHALTSPVDSWNRASGVLGAIKSDPLGSIEILTHATKVITDPIIDAKKPLSERIKGPVRLSLDIATGHALGLGLGRVLNAAAELDAVKAIGSKVSEIKAGIKASLFGEEAAKTGLRVWGTGQSLGAEAEGAALLKLPPDHPLRKIGAFNEAAKKAGPKFDPRLVKGDSLLDVTDPAYEKGMQAIKAAKNNPKYLTPEARKVADAVRYDQHMRAQESAMQKMLAEHPEFKGHIEGLENTGSHAHRRSGKFNDIDSNLRGDGSDIGAAAEKAYPKYYRDAVPETSQGNLTHKDLNSNCYGDRADPGALTTPTGKDFVGSVQGSGGGRLDVYDAETGRYLHSLDGKDPLLSGDRPFFKRGSPAEAAKSIKEFGNDVANKHFAETADLGLDGKLNSAIKNAKTIRTISGKVSQGQLPAPELPESVANILKDPSALPKQEALNALEDYFRQLQQ